jgi:hypothetical protein
MKRTATALVGNGVADPKAMTSQAEILSKMGES